ncbi:alpha/beta hydrolase family esterase [Actinomadura algeriensis]|uniref:Polyhydroxybutyrate depolymerase n=1 Tax=Actinomadura algeriensis TaxID=1679523 RepID=A0ABR9JKI6_9ACTN|nr:PHB depolymerase family esterase [Actinomadura algeriensis]MBE1531028.1 polyhydroxybutyrate depolymerase [Actinomadura algeriensis]
MRRILVVVAAVSLLLAGCSDDGGGGDPGEGGRPAKVDGVPTGAGTHKQKLKVDAFGHREYLLHVPPKVAEGKWKDGRPAEPPALVLALHGGLADMNKAEDRTGFSDLADEKGFLVAYPNGFMTTWNAGDCCGAAKIGGIDDVEFLAELITKLTDAGLADPDRVFVTGFSNGAGMAYKFACRKPDMVAGIGAVEGALVTECDPGKPVSAMIVHGTADSNVPFKGGGDRDFNDKRPFPPVSKAVDFWRKLAGLGELSEDVAGLGENGNCKSTGKGPGGFAVALCTIAGGTHEWPSGASERLWEFFADHPREG